MLKEADLDIVSVVTAPQLRAEPVVAALGNGMHDPFVAPAVPELEAQTPVAKRMLDVLLGM
jgi:hypothetical protein